ncbi:MAG TPA: hypothetical protein VGN13_00635 [Solirubrobacteraceae bacterium]|jgi:hypothetical protein
MLSILLSAAITCLGSLSIGQGAMALLGARRWTWLSAPVGVALMILVAVPAIHVPGRALTVAIAMFVLIAAGIVLWVVRPAHRPPAAGLLAGAPVVLLVLVPFAASGRGGTLGVSFDNDMASHLLLAEAYRSSAVALVSPLLPDYPLGPHALAAALGEGLGVRTDLAFAGLTAATPVLIGWTALASVRARRWPAQVLVATVVGIPFLIAAYYGQGSFKELLEALFALAAALLLAAPTGGLRWRRWIPFAVVCAGAVSVYSLGGLVWPGVLLGIWLLGRVLIASWRGGRAAWAELKAEMLPGAIGLGVLIVLLVPQIPRIEKFVSRGASNSIAKTNLGNLVGPLPGWEAFGVWGSPDYRVAPASAFTAGMWTAFVLALVVLGGLVLMRRGRWMLSATAVAVIVVWAYAADTQSPYVAAKALVIASPLLMLLAVLAVTEMELGAWWWRLAAPLLAVVLLVRVVDSSWESLRGSRVGPTAHLRELRSLRPLLGSGRTLYLGDDDFIQWELAGARVTPAFLAPLAEVPLRPEKGFAYGQPLDFDSVTAATLNEFQWVITTRDAAGSQAPAGMQLARVTSSYELWRRVAPITPRRILDEGPNAAAVLDCATRSGRALVRAGGIAAIRQPSREVPVPPIAPGASTTVALSLPAGSWELETPYYSPLVLTVTSAGLHAVLPANLERPGPRWPIGRIVLHRPGSVAVTFHVVEHRLSPASDTAIPTTLIATATGGERLVPLRHACGKLVDWFET